ncbi:SMP-30/gluconolactonase/LRE family protein [Microlunatus panaciterrae]|uniref:Gluconolactonase n=1 Tax=Microlunatus panaciterrae TaxID=400768 RepID=A0ABS2RF43_9ACTN|nr:SMP-30/gluconolactonase/LRE family protein [Microlunatus panaciterrae]MBM7797619.1 gluconolactonase [Microlunatus panaciterrae]
MTEFLSAQFQVLDDRFRGTGGDRQLEKVFDRGRWLEGPAYHPAVRCVLFSDIPNDRVLRFDEVTGRVDVFTSPAGFANGRIVDRQGRFVSCEHGDRRLTRLEHDGTVTVLADSFEGRPLNSPNDVVQHSDGSLWFTDPAYGIDTDYEGHAAEPEQSGCHVYRLSPDGRLDRVADDFDRPNGLAFSADEQRLYVVDTPRAHIRVFEVVGDTLTGGEVFATCDAGGFDGIRFDQRGRLWAAAHDGLHCFESDGTLVGKLLVPETVANLCFGGPQRNQLFITATTSLYTLRVNFRGAVYP